MIWGCQWDQILIWMKEVKNTSQNSYYVIDALNMGNILLEKYRLKPTGSYEVKNVYDLSGNVFDSTLEASANQYRVSRGACYDYPNTRCGYGAEFRCDGGGYMWTGSRATLY